MEVIINQREYELFYPYDKKYIKNYPEQYPCVCKKEYWDGNGLSGGSWEIYVAYFPPQDKSVTQVFLEALKNPWKRLV